MVPLGPNFAGQHVQLNAEHCLVGWKDTLRLAVCDNRLSDDLFSDETSGDFRESFGRPPATVRNGELVRRKPIEPMNP